MVSALAGGGPAKGGKQPTKGGKLQTGKVTSSAHQKQMTMQRVVMGRGGRGVTDSGNPMRNGNSIINECILSDSDVEPQEDMLSRRSSPSTSPRHSLATPSSYGGDDMLLCGANAQMGATHQTNNIGMVNSMGMSGGGMHGEEKTMSDSRSVDSGGQSWGNRGKGRLTVGTFQSSNLTIPCNNSNNKGWPHLRKANSKSWKVWQPLTISNR